MAYHGSRQVDRREVGDARDLCGAEAALRNGARAHKGDLACALESHARSDPRPGPKIPALWGERYAERQLEQGISGISPTNDVAPDRGALFDRRLSAASTARIARAGCPRCRPRTSAPAGFSASPCRARCRVDLDGVASAGARAPVAGRAPWEACLHERLATEAGLDGHDGLSRPSRTARPPRAVCPA
jgi:hypothetical protein